MLIELKMDSSIHGGDDLSDQTKTVVKEALNRFQDRINRVDIHLSTTNNHRAGAGDALKKSIEHALGRESTLAQLRDHR